MGELRIVPDPLWIDVLGVTAESDEGADSEGTVVDGIPSGSVTTEELARLDDPQLVQGTLAEAGLV